MRKNLRLFLVVMVVLALMLTIVACKEKTPDATTAKDTTAAPVTTTAPSTTVGGTPTTTPTTTVAPTTSAPATSDTTPTTTAPVTTPTTTTAPVTDPVVPDNKVEGAAGSWIVEDGVYTSVVPSSIIYLGTADDIFAGYTFEFCMKKSGAEDAGFLFGINDIDGDGKYWEGTDVEYVFYGAAKNAVDINAFWIRQKTASVASWGGWQEIQYKPANIPADNEIRIKFTPSLSEDGKKVLITAWFTYDMTSENPEWTLMIENKALVTVNPDNLGNGFGLRSTQVGGTKFWGIKITEPEKPEPILGANGQWLENRTDIVSAAPNSIMVLGKDFTTGIIAAKMLVASDVNVESYNGLIFGVSDVDGIFWENKGTSYYFLSTDKDGNLVLTKVVDGTTTVLGTAPIANYATDKKIELKASVSPDGSIKAYADGALLLTVKDDAPLKGTLYGVRAGDEGISFDTKIVKTIITDTVADNYNIVYGDVASDFESLVSLKDNTIVLAKKDAKSAVGRYMLSYTDNEGQNGLIAAYSYGANGSSYYYVYVIETGYIVCKVAGNTFTTLKTVYVEDFTYAGAHNIILEIVETSATACKLIASVDGNKVELTDNAALTGKMYGAILSKDASLTNIGYFNSIPAANAGYNPIHNPEDSMFFDSDFVVHGGKDTIALKVDTTAASSAGQFVLKFNNTASGKNGLIFAHSITGSNTFEGRGTSYYFAYLNDEGVVIAKVDGGELVDKNTFKFASSPVVEKHLNGINKGSYTRAGEHELVINYSGNGNEGSNAIIWVTLDGLYLGSWADADPLFGKGYGVRSGAAGTEFTELRRDSLRLENSIYPTSGARDLTVINKDGSAYLGDGTIVLASDPAKKTVGRYTLSLNNVSDRRSGLVFCYNRTGTDTWTGAGTSYYFLNIDEGGNSIDIIKYDSGNKKESWWAGTYKDLKTGNHTFTADVHENGLLVFWYDGIYVGSVIDDEPLTGTGYGIRGGQNAIVLNSVTYSETIPEYEIKTDAANKPSNLGGGKPEWRNKYSYVVQDGLYSMGYNTIIELGETEDSCAGYTYEWTMQKNKVGDSGLIFGVKEAGTVDGKFWQDAQYGFYGLSGGGDMNCFWIDEGWVNKVSGWQNEFAPQMCKNAATTGYDKFQAVRFKLEVEVSDDDKIVISIWYKFDVENEDAAWTLIGENAKTNITASKLGTGFGFRAGNTGCKLWDVKVYETADTTNVVFDSNN